MFVSIYGVFQKRFVDLSTCRLVAKISIKYLAFLNILLTFAV